MMTSKQFLRALFGIDPKAAKVAEIEPLVYAEAKLRLGTQPWWPPLAEVWIVGPNPPKSWHGSPEDWRNAHELLRRLHADYIPHRHE
jgi:hypothetical protein